MQEHISSLFLDRFEELGLSRNESSVYLALLNNHPVTGYKLAKDSGILRPVVYETLTRLVEKGGVKIVKDNPEQYSPISPGIFLMSLEKRFTDAKKELIKELITYQEQDNENDDFWNISNRDTIISYIQSIANKAKKDILFYINNPTYAFLLKDIFSKKVLSGIQVIGFSYRDIQLPGTDLYSFKVDENISDPCIKDEKILIVVDGKNSIMADMDVGKAVQSMRSAQVFTIQEYIKMKIILYRISHIMDPSKLSLYLFEEDKQFFKKLLQ